MKSLTVLRQLKEKTELLTNIKNGREQKWEEQLTRTNSALSVSHPKVELDVETGQMIEIFEEDGTPVFEGTRPKLNPEYDPNQPYISHVVERD